MRLAQHLDATGRALLVLAAAFDSPLAIAAERVTRDPRRSEIQVDGVPASLYLPGGGAHPALVLLNGATERGREHPRIVRLAKALTRAGHVVLVPDVPGIVRGEVTAAGVDATVGCVLYAARRREARPARVGVLGISVGTTLALLAAEEDRLRDRVSVVAGLTGYTDLADLIRLATTGTYREGERIRAYDAGPFLWQCVARSVCAGLEAGAARHRIAAALDGADPRAALGSVDPRDGGDAEAALTLLTNRDPQLFDDLYAALPARLRSAVDRLSPVCAADRLRVPVELLVDPHDKYFPLDHAFRLARASPSVRVTVTDVLAHADSRLSWNRAREAARLAGFVRRTLQLARFS